MLPLVVAFAPFLRRAEQSVQATAAVKVPWRPIVLVGLAMVLFYMVDTAAFTWGPQYLDQVFPTPSHLVALAVFPYLLASGVIRWSGDTLVARYGAVRVLRIGTVIASVGLAITVFAPVWPVAVVGFFITGGGVAVVAPLSFSAAARIAGQGEPDPVLRHARVDAVIARFNQFNYVGALLGAVMTGLVGAGNLRIGFAVPMVLVLGILPLAKAFAPVSALPRHPAIGRVRWLDCVGPASSCPAAAPAGRAARRHAPRGSCPWAPSPCGGRCTRPGRPGCSRSSPRGRHPRSSLLFDSHLSSTVVSP